MGYQYPNQKSLDFSQTPSRNQYELRQDPVSAHPSGMTESPLAGTTRNIGFRNSMKGSAGTSQPYSAKPPPNPLHKARTQSDNNLL